MATINSETVYDVTLSNDELNQLASGGNISLELPSGDTIRLASTSTALPSQRADAPAPDEDTDLEEIEELVKEADQQKKAAMGDEGDVPPEDDEDADAEAQTGNARKEHNGMIEIERGGEVE